MGASTVREITRETCEIIWNKLFPIYIPIPSRDDWRRISLDFERQWNFPHCVGAIDGKHVNIACPPNYGSMFYNYKGKLRQYLV